MGRLSREDLDRYDSVVADGCYICKRDDGLGTNTSHTIYHPHASCLPKDSRGVALKVCQSCYVAYKAQSLGCFSLDMVIARLSKRSRRNRGPNGNPNKWTLGLTIYFSDNNTVLDAEDRDGLKYDVEDVQKFLELRSSLWRLRGEDLQKACEQYFTDQRFINKVVSSFSS